MWYLIGMLLSWFVITLSITVHHGDEDDLGEIISNTAVGGMLSLIWPLVLIGVGFVFLVQFVARRYYGNSN